VVAAASAGAFSPALIAAGFSDAQFLVPAVFMLICVTVLAHGFSLGPLTRLLKLGSPGKGRILIVGASPWAIELALELKNLKQDVIIADSEWARLQTARQRGIETWFGEVLSDMAEEAMALDNIYTVLAATGNNHYNSMVCNHYAPHIGRHRVFQPHDSGSEREKHQVPETRRGITAFSSNVSYAEMWTRLIRGWGFRKTSITESFDESQFLSSLPDEAVQLALIPESGKLEWLSKSSRRLQNGDTVISFVPPDAKKVTTKPEVVTSTKRDGGTPVDLPA
jgi:hypothetical protein